MRYAAILFGLAVAGILIGALVLVSAYGDDDEEVPVTTATPVRTATRAPTPTDKVTTTPDPLAGVCADNPDPASADRNQVNAPLPGDSVTSPVIISGEIAAFEATFRIKIFDGAGVEIADKIGMSADGTSLSPFSESVSFVAGRDTPACVWVFEESADDGRAVNVVQIPVLLEESESVCLPNPDPATDEFNQVDAPLPGVSLTSPITVSGRIAAFEAHFRITIFDAAGGQIADQTALSSEGQVLAPFSESVAFSVAARTPACIWVYEPSARDGLPIHVVQIPVTLEP